MVYYKRKTVAPLAPKYTPVNESTDVWVIDQTLEYFVNYDDYLKRIDFYRQPKFVCELTGHSCLTFFQACEQEKKETEFLMRQFPEPLKKPILERIQFSQVSRVDQLVDQIYTALRSEFFPGEIVTARKQNPKVQYIVCRKSENRATQSQDGTNLYTVRTNTDNPETRDIDAKELSRDRKLVSKLALRAFIKHSASRNSFANAPWIVEYEYAYRYQIPTEIPDHIRNLLNERKICVEIYGKTYNMNEKANLSEVSRDDVAEDSRQAPPLAKTSESKRRRTTRGKQPTGPANYAITATVNEDLIEMLLRERTVCPTIPLPAWRREEKLCNDALGKALEVWSFLNVFNQKLLLEPINFDEFLEALTSKTPNDDLILTEIHCALLSQLVEAEGNELAFQLPQQEGCRNAQNFPEESESEDDDEEREQEDNKDNASISSYMMRGSVNKEDTLSNVCKSEAEDEETVELLKCASSYLLFQNINWKERIGKRAYVGGGWQIALVSLLYTVQHIQDWKAVVVRCLSAFVKSDVPVGIAEILHAYTSSKPEQRTEALWILARCLYASPAIREFMDQRADQIAKLKKQKADMVRDTKNIKGNLKNQRDCDKESVKKDVMYQSKLSNGDHQKLQKQYADLQVELEQIDRELRRLSCMRLQMIGKDRFYNRYWYLEYNGMPVRRLETAINTQSLTGSNDENQASSDSGKPREECTTDSYLMGRLWIQGPSDEDYEVFLVGEKWTDMLTRKRQEILDKEYESQLHLRDETIKYQKQVERDIHERDKAEKCVQSKTRLDLLKGESFPPQAKKEEAILMKGPIDHTNTTPNFRGNSSHIPAQTTPVAQAPQFSNTAGTIHQQPLPPSSEYNTPRNQQAFERQEEVRQYFPNAGLQHPHSSPSCYNSSLQPFPSQPIMMPLPVYSYYPYNYAPQGMSFVKFPAPPVPWPSYQDFIPRVPMNGPYYYPVHYPNYANVMTPQIPISSLNATQKYAARVFSIPQAEGSPGGSRAGPEQLPSIYQPPSSAPEFALTCPSIHTAASTSGSPASTGQIMQLSEQKDEEGNSTLDASVDIIPETPVKKIVEHEECAQSSTVISPKLEPIVVTEPVRTIADPVSGLALKKEVEGESFLARSDWRYIASEADFNTLLTWLQPTGHRENQLLAELKKIRCELCTSMKDRLKWLDSHDEWNNKYAIKLLGHRHLSRRKRRP